MTQNIVYFDAATEKPLPQAAALQVAAGSAKVHVVTDAQAALAAINSIPAPHLTAFVANQPNPTLFRSVRDRHADAATILVSGQPMHVYSAALEGDEHKLLDHVMANRNNPAWLVHELRVTLQKLVTSDIFGLEKYMLPGTTAQVAKVAGSNEREGFNAAAMKFAEQNHLGQSASKMIFGIVEEMLMNAIYDAPVAAGVTRFKTTSRNSLITLEPQEQPTLSYACDGETFAISVQDPFGALRQDKLLEYLKKVLRRTDSNQLIDTKEGGAGLGLFKIFYCSHALVCNVDPGKCTEVIALIDLNEQLRDFTKMPRSVHYFRK